MSAPFSPYRIYIDESVLNLETTQKILSFFPEIAAEIVVDYKMLKKPKEMSWAKRGLLLAHFKSDQPLRSFEANAQSIGRPYYSLNLISNCPLECTYCILQSYLANNPLITIYTNIEEVLKKITAQLESIPRNSVISTGQIADSLALEKITGFHQKLIPFFKDKKFLFEMKTKWDDVEPLLNLEHGGRTVISWSVNPETIIQREEIKTANLKKRLIAAQKASAAGYKIGFHLDPMIAHENWENNYAELLENIFDCVEPKKIIWMSLGVLRFPARQKTIMQKRFPNSKKIFEGLEHSHLPFLTYDKKLRKEMIAKLSKTITKLAPSISVYSCMEN